MKPLDTGDFIPALDLADAYAAQIDAGEYVIDSFGQFQVASVSGRAPSGAELRRRLITPEALAAIHEEEPKKTLLQRLLKRK